ncbi:MAG: ABC transporter substrate-binding protein [Desulfovibrio sp.]|mgnify:CR=1 FL=1|nr:ABC transporter substrate-binding protein [Desulfovibrio sp.]|tara:strand:- start:1134 stop:2471 length:1338 start_codon:yes stop_codon:yes gene_type:complete
MISYAVVISCSRRFGIQYITSLFGTLLCLVAAHAIVPSTASADHANDLIFLHYWTDDLSGGINEMMQAYNKLHDKAPVRATGFEHESFKVGINVMLDSGHPPDMFSYWAGARTETLVNLNYLTPIDQVWLEAGLDSIFSPTVQKACTYHGHKYALPLTQHYAAFFYNKKLFEQHALKPPTDWKSFLKACETLKQAGVTPIALGSRDKWPAQFWFDYLLLRTAGPAFRDKLMKGDKPYDDPRVIEAFAMWKGLLDSGYFNQMPNLLDWAEAAKLVHSGQAGMTLMGTWIIGLFENQLHWKQEEDYDFFRFPIINKSLPLTALGSMDVVLVPRHGRHSEVNKILAYLSKPEPQMAMSRGSGAFSPSSAVTLDFYPPMQQRILKTIRSTPNWASNYDLSTRPCIARQGLDMMARFIDSPDTYNTLLQQLAKDTCLSISPPRSSQVPHD